jgi:hypothetical protein
MNRLFFTIILMFVMTGVSAQSGGDEIRTSGSDAPKDYSKQTDAPKDYDEDVDKPGAPKDYSKETDAPKDYNEDTDKPVDL